MTFGGSEGEDEANQTDERIEFPFEFKALEVVLEGICGFHDSQTRELEAVAYPTLDELPTQDCIGAIDDTHIPATVFGRDTNSYWNRHGTISQNILAACNFDLEFIFVLSGWKGSSHDSNVLTDALSRNNGLKVLFFFCSICYLFF